MPPSDLPFPVRHCDPADREVGDGRYLPHWRQAGTISFLTWRTADSLPRAVLDRLTAERAEWMRTRGQRRLLAPRADSSAPISDVDASGRASNPLAERAVYVGRPGGGDAEPLPPADAAAYYRFTQSRFNRALDSGLGACPLRDPACAAIVAASLHHFDGDQYALFDFIVMPNHVHVLAAFPDDDAMRKRCESWKHFTAVRLNRMTGGRGRFWQSESFDHLCRSDAQFVALRDYIAMNPVRAGLPGGEYSHYSRDLVGFGFHTVHSNPLAERAGNTREHSP